MEVTNFGRKAYQERTKQELIDYLEKLPMLDRVRLMYENPWIEGWLNASRH